MNKRPLGIGCLGLGIVMIGLLIVILGLGDKLMPGIYSTMAMGRRVTALAPAEIKTLALPSTPVPSITPTALEGSPTAQVDTGLPNPLDRFSNSSMSPVETLLLNGLDMQLAVPLPPHPQQMTLYRRQPETLTEEGAKALIAQFGILGPVKSQKGEAGNDYYSASNDAYTMNVYSDSSPFFGFGHSLPPTGDIPDQFTQEEREKLAEAFLHEHGLLNFPNRIEPVYGPDGQNHAAAVSQLVDGVPLYQGEFPWIWVLLDGEGQVMNVCYQKLQLAPDGEVVLRPVDAVWNDLQSHALDERSSLRILSDEDWQGDPFTQKAIIDQGELVYFAMNTNGMWVGSIPADNPMRMVQPIWRFTGKLTDGTPLEILAEAAARPQSETSLSSQPTALPTQAGLPPSQTVTGEIGQNGGDSTVNVRVGPSALFDQIGTLSTGQTVEVTGRSPHWDWWRIRAEELEGWVFSAFMTVKNAQAVPCVEMNAGDCGVPTVPGGGEQAVASIRAMAGDSNLALTFREETQNPNGDLRKTWIYVDDQGEEYWVDQETLRVVQWMPKPAGPSGEVKTSDALRSLALTFAYHQSPRLEKNASSLTFTETTKDGSAYAFRWEDPDRTGLMMSPFLQVIIRPDGQILQYMNTLDVLRP